MRKAVYCFIALLLYCFIIAPSAQASDSWKSLPPNTCAPYPVLSACNLTYIMETNVSTLTTLILGADKGVGAGIGLLYQVPPVSGRDYLSYMSSQFHIPGTPTTAYAAVGGIGYNSLGPVLKIWVIMRNLAYFVFAIIFIVIGVMISIRSKIDPKTTINIQNALPKIILALILVTFSYAIAGFLIDIMYVAIGLILTILGSIDSDTKNLISGVIEQNIFKTYLDGSTWANIGNASQAINIVLQDFIGTGASGANGVQIISGQIFGLVGGAIAFLIIAIAILWALFKTWLSLLSAYANIILGIIFSPLQLMIDAIPGQNQFDGWLRNMLANLLSFPAVITMIGIGQYLAKLNTNNTGSTPGFVPPLIGGGDVSAIQSLIGIAIILTIPKAVEMVQEAIKAPKSKFGSAWSEAMGKGWQGTQFVGTPVVKRVAPPVWSGVKRGYQSASTELERRTGVGLPGG